MVQHIKKSSALGSINVCNYCRLILMDKRHTMKSTKIWKFYIHIVTLAIVKWICVHLHTYNVCEYGTSKTMLKLFIKYFKRQNQKCWQHYNVLHRKTKDPLDHLGHVLHVSFYIRIRSTNTNALTSTCIFKIITYTHNNKAQISLPINSIIDKLFNHHWYTTKSKQVCFNLLEVLSEACQVYT